MKKLSKKQKIWTIVASVIVILFIIIEFCLGFTVKSTINNIAPSILGTDVKVEDVDIRPFRGKVYIEGFVVGAPEGFKNDIFNLTKFNLDFNFWSIFSDTMVINDITIEDPIVAYELKGINSNIGKLMERFEKAEEKEEDDAKKTKGKKVVIKHFKFSGGKVKIASSTLGGAALPIPLPVIELTGIGEKSGGVTALEATGEIIVSIGKGVIVAVKDIALGATGLVGDAAGATVDAAGAAVGAVGDAAGAAVGFVGGLFGGDSDEEKEPAKPEEK